MKALRIQLLTTKYPLLMAAIYITQCFYRSEASSPELIGCFEDTPERALPVYLKLKSSSNVLSDCEKKATLYGYEVFGIQNQRECWSGPNAHSTYDQYGRASDCENELGGKWSNSVYRLEQDPGSLAGLLGELIASAKSIEDIDVGVFIQSSSKLLNLSDSEWRSNPKLADNFLSASEGLLELGLNSTKPVNASTGQMKFSVKNVDITNQTSLVFPDPTLSQEMSNGFVVPTIENSTSSNIGGIVYSNLDKKLRTVLNDTDDMFQPGHYQEISSLVISCQVNPPVLFGINTNRTIMITLQHKTEVKHDAKPICAFWNFPENGNLTGVWSTDGCNVVSSNKTHTQCNCTHLTNFAILMQYKEVKIADHHKRILTILTNIGCSLSLAALFVTVGVYFAFGLYKSINFHIHTNLCFAIALTQIFLLSAAQATEHKAACIVVSAFFHYFCLSIFTWMLVEGLQIYRKVVSIFSSSLNLFHCHLIGWGCPVLVVLISYGSRKDNYTDLKICWISTEYGIRWSFIGPVLFVITVNMIVTGITLFKRLHLKSVATKEITFKLRTSIRALLVLLPIFGVTWVIGIFGFTSDAVPVMYIFVMLNSSQGVLIFIFHCVWNTEVRKAVLGGRRKRSRGKNGTLSSQVNKIQSLKHNFGSNENSRQSSSRSAKDQDCPVGLQLTESDPPAQLNTNIEHQKYLAP